jgi:hypothetical protein
MPVPDFYLTYCLCLCIFFFLRFFSRINVTKRNSRYIKNFEKPIIPRICAIVLNRCAMKASISFCNASGDFLTRPSKNSTSSKPQPLPSTNLKEKKKRNYLPHANIYQKNSTSLKLQPPYPTNLKKEKGFFFSFRFNRSYALTKLHTAKSMG